VTLGTCYDFEKIANQWKEKFSAQEVRFLFEAAEEVLSSQGVSCLEALQRREVGTKLALLHGELDLYVEGKERVELLRSLENLSLHIWGRGPWKKYLPNAKVHAPIPFQKVPTLLRQSKVVLNAAPRFKDGSHERIFYGLACGALPLTGKNLFIQENFSEEEDILTYPHGEYQQVQEKLVAILERERERVSRVERGKEKVMQKHTWEARAEILLNFLYS
jgi:spore maturation protein CgeB